MTKIEDLAFIQDDNVKNFQVLGVPVLSMDKYGHLDLSNAIPVFDGPIPVIEDSEDGEVIGAATLYCEGKVVKADIFIDYSSPIRLDLQSGNSVYPMVGLTLSKVKADRVQEITLGSLILTTIKTDNQSANLLDYVVKD